VIVADRLASGGAALKVLNAIDKRETGLWLNNRVENSHQPFRRRESGRCSGSGRCEVCKHSPRFTAPCATTSTRNDTSHPGQYSRIAAPLHSLSGVSFARPDSCRGRALSETFLIGLTAPQKSTIKLRKPSFMKQVF